MNSQLMASIPTNRCSAVILGFLILILSTPSAAEDSLPEKQNSGSSTKAASGIVVLPKLDLGVLEIKNLEPTRNQTSKVTFAMHLTFPPETDPAIVTALGHWQHRLREQVIVAIRVAELGDYMDPRLLRLRKQILYRINRVLKGIQAQDVLLADFTFATE